MPAVDRATADDAGRPQTSRGGRAVANLTRAEARALERSAPLTPAQFTELRGRSEQGLSPLRQKLRLSHAAHSRPGLRPGRLVASLVCYGLRAALRACAAAAAAAPERVTRTRSRDDWAPSQASVCATRAR